MGIGMGVGIYARYGGTAMERFAMVTSYEGGGGSESKASWISSGLAMWCSTLWNTGSTVEIYDSGNCLIDDVEPGLVE